MRNSLKLFFIFIFSLLVFCNPVFADDDSVHETEVVFSSLFPQFIKTSLELGIGTAENCNYDSLVHLSSYDTIYSGERFSILSPDDFELFDAPYTCGKFSARSFLSNKKGEDKFDLMIGPEGTYLGSIPSRGVIVLR